MFVWDCIKGEGKHLGRCVDRFLFGTCCGHDVGENSLSDEAHLFHVYGADPSTGLSFVTVRLNLSETANTTTVAPDSSEIHTNTPQSTIVFHDGGLRAPEIPTDVTALSVTVQSSVESSTVNSQSQTPVVTGGVQDYYAAVVPHSQQQEIPDVKTKSSTTRTTTTLKTTTMATTLPASSQPGITAIQSTPAAHVDMTTTLSTQKVSPTAVVVTTTRPTTTVVSTLATTSTLFTTSQVMGIEGTPSPTPARVPSKVFRGNQLTIYFLN